MKLRSFPAVALLSLVVSRSAGSYTAHSQDQMAAPDWQQVAQALGKAGSMQPGGVYPLVA